jgi:predicted nucleotidyltransferase component of viral defense system
MINIEQVKAKIRNIASSKDLNAQEILQIYMFERFLDRLAISEYQQNFVIKGGLLIASMIGVSERSTMDMDATIVGLPLTDSFVEKMIGDIISIDVNDGITFEFERIQPIRVDDEYFNFSVSMTARVNKTRTPLKIDITTGDVITPSQIDYSYSLMFEDRSVNLKVYPLETILAEKIETILRRNITTTRARDFYDVYMLYKIKRTEISWDTLSLALANTSRLRDSIEELKDAREII